MSISDRLMLRYYELLTTESLPDVQARHPMEAKQDLAYQIVARYHGDHAAAEARDAFRQRFSQREFPDQPDAHLFLTSKDILDAREPTVNLLELIIRTKLISSKSEARRLIVQGGVEVDEQKQSDPNMMLSLRPGQHLRLRIGRRKYALVEYGP